MYLRSLIIVISLFVVLMGRVAYACSYLPASSSVDFTGDMEHVFVMFTGGKLGLDGEYRASGLYRLDGSRDPLWTVDWNANSVFIHSDAESMVQLGSRADAEPPSSEVLHLSKKEMTLNNNPDKWIENRVKDLGAISFYISGELIHEYMAGDLVNDYSKVESRPCWGLHWMSDYVFEESSNQFRLATVENISYTFSITTGEIVNLEKYDRRQYKKIKRAEQIQKLQKREGRLSDKTMAALLDLVDADWKIVSSLGSPYLSDYLIAKEIIGVHGASYYYFDSKLQAREDLSRLAVTSGYASPISHLTKHRDNERILRAAVKYNGTNYNYLPDKLKQEKRLLLQSFHFGGMYTYDSAPADLQGDREVIIAALRAQLQIFYRSNHWSEYWPNYFDAKFEIKYLGGIPEHYLGDERIKHLLDAVIEVHSSGYGEHMVDEHRQDAYKFIRATR